MKKILFVSHDSSRTGAPIVLLNFMNWLKAQNKFDLEVFTKSIGPLDKDMEEFIRVHLPVSKGLVKRVIKKAVSKLIDVEAVYKLPTSLKNKKFDLIYLNTIVCLDIANLLYETFKCPIICHGHENEYTINHYYPGYVTNDNIKHISQFIAVSKSTKDNLVQNYNIPVEKISLVYALIRTNKIKQPTLNVQHIKTELFIQDEFVIGGSGLTIWRKGIDLFVQLAVELNKIKPGNNIKLLWVGRLYDEFKIQFDYEAERLGIVNKIIFTGVKPQAQNYFQVFDVFALTSREDPFPLVVLEAAALKKPIILFENSGGIPEIFNADHGGIIIPYGDVHAMALQILSIADQKEKLKLMGEQAESLVKQFDINIIGEQLVEVIENTLKQ